MAPGNAILDEGNPADASAASVSEIDPRAAAYLVDAGDAVLIDVREPDERLVSAVPGSMPMPLSAFEPDAVTISADETVLFERGGPTGRDASAVFGAEKVVLRVDLAAGPHADRHLTCDLTAEYVHINADYTT